MKLFNERSKDVTEPSEPVVGTAGSLREFVYLDEVSVYSLTSAPDRPPPVTMSESADSSTGEVLSAQIEGGVPIVAKANLSGELNSGRTEGLQIQRQFNIQSQFARLHGLYQSTFLLSARGDDLEIGTTSDIEVALDRLEVANRAIRATSLARGALIETRVSLRAHHVFDVTEFIRLVGGLFKKYPALAEMDSSTLQTVLEGGELLAELMEDLVPIEGRSTTHVLVTGSNGELWVAETNAFRAAYEGDANTEPLRVVGVAEAGSFWKDTRRILHADAEFDVLGRVSRASLQDEWTPVKMVDTFKRVVPSVATALLEAVESLRTITADAAPREPVPHLVLAGSRLDRDLANLHQVQPVGLSPEVLIALAIADGTLEGGLVALNEVADAFYAHHAALERDNDRVAALRQAAWTGTQAAIDLPADTVGQVEARTSTPVLELEFIAMYW